MSLIVLLALLAAQIHARSITLKAVIADRAKVLVGSEWTKIVLSRWVGACVQVVRQDISIDEVGIYHHLDVILRTRILDLNLALDPEVLV